MLMDMYIRVIESSKFFRNRFRFRCFNNNRLTGFFCNILKRLEMIRKEFYLLKKIQFIEKQNKNEII